MELTNIKKLNLCNGCNTRKIDCPYPAAYNSKELAHQACDKAYTPIRTPEN